MPNLENGLMARLGRGQKLCVAEGYIFEFERRGYLQAGCFVPEVVVDHPDVVEALYKEFVHAGSDVVLAATYYAHREKLRIIGRDGQLEEINRKALKIARKVADDTNTLMAGNICNTSLYDLNNPDMNQSVDAIFKEQVEWAVDEGADYIVAETFTDYGEAELALQAIKKYGKGLPAVVSLFPNESDHTHDGVDIVEGCKKLEDAGADVVGLNCSRGPGTMLPLIEKVRKACKGPVCCLPVVYHTTPENKTMLSLKTSTGERAFPIDLPPHQCTRTEVAEFTKKALEIGVDYIGLCCGNSSHYTRVMAECMGRKPTGSKYTADMSKHIFFGTDPTIPTYSLELKQLLKGK